MLGFDLRRAAANKRFQLQFQDEGQIGSGGFSVVHRVRHRIDQRMYAAKIISIKPSYNSDDNQQKLYRFLAQPKAQALLSHPNIIEYHGCWIELVLYTQQQKNVLSQQNVVNESEFEMVLLDGSSGSDGICFGVEQSEGGYRDINNENKRSIIKKGDGLSFGDYKQIKIYILSELCSNNLHTFIVNRSIYFRGQKFSYKQILENYVMILQMVDGLAYLHSKRIIHRDIKLHNIMVGKNGEIKIIDFGLAKRVKYWKTSIEDFYVGKQKEEEEVFSTSVGTRLFSSPEQASSEKYDYRTDIYSLGVIICLMFCRYTTAHQQRDLLEKIRKRSLEDIDMCFGLKELVFRMLGSENQRPSLGELQKCLKESMKILKRQKIESTKYVEQNELGE